MSLDATSPIGGSPRVARVDSPAPSSAGGPHFATALQRQLEQPRAEIAQVRAEISSIRNGGILSRLAGNDSPDFGAATPWADAATSMISPRSASTPAQIAAFLAQHATGNAADPYGWHQMSRQVGDSVIGPGYGAMFERQIDQESGFAPDVVTGQRRSSAGAEGIAQLMPQFYPHVNRTDPAQSLQAGAQSMQQYLRTWNGDVRKALASYNCGLGAVQNAVAARGAAWESAIPQETRDYLAAIVGGTRPVFSPGHGFGAGEAAPLSPSTALGLGAGLRALGGLDTTR